MSDRKGCVCEHHHQHKQSKPVDATKLSNREESQESEGGYCKQEEDCVIPQQVRVPERENTDNSNISRERTLITVTSAEREH